MRKIISRHEKEKNKRMKQLLVGGVLILIITISTLAYSFGFSEKTEEGSKSKVIYNGLKFTEKNGFWLTEISGFQFSFKYNPEQTENLKTDYITKTINNYYREPLYIYSESIEAEYEIYRNLDQFILRRQYACLEEEEAEKCKDLPIKTCNNNFIIIKENSTSEIKQNQSCIFIQGKKEELTKLTDKFLFKILGVQ